MKTTMVLGGMCLSILASAGCAAEVDDVEDVGVIEEGAITAKDLDDKWITLAERNHGNEPKAKSMAPPNFAKLDLRIEDGENRFSSKRYECGVVQIGQNVETRCDGDNDGHADPTEVEFSDENDVVKNLWELNGGQNWRTRTLRLYRKTSGNEETYLRLHYNLYKGGGDEDEARLRVITNSRWKKLSSDEKDCLRAKFTMQLSDLCKHSDLDGKPVFQVLVRD